MSKETELLEKSIKTADELQKLSPEAKYEYNLANQLLAQQFVYVNFQSEVEVIWDLYEHGQISPECAMARLNIVVIDLHQRLEK